MMIQSDTDGLFLFYAGCCGISLYVSNVTLAFRNIIFIDQQCGHKKFPVIKKQYSDTQTGDVIHTIFSKFVDNF